MPSTLLLSESIAHTPGSLRDWSSGVQSVVTKHETGQLHAWLAEALADFLLVRQRSEALVAQLEVEDLGLQPMPGASPLKWHLAHTTWFFETFLLKPFLAGYRTPDPRYEYLFNSYYNGVGEQYPRHRRGDMSRPTLVDVTHYRRHVDAAMLKLLEDGDGLDVLRRTVLGIQHEEQHQELMVTDLKYSFAHNPLQPVLPQARQVPECDSARPLTFTDCDGGLLELGSMPATGTRRTAFAFDNEGPRHRVWLEPYALADRCVTVGEYLAFMADGGYERAEFWLSDGWAWLQEQGRPRAPLYWFQQHDRWWHYMLAGPQSLDDALPVCHISGYEADAYARWAGCRLPTEAEWEAASVSAGRAGNWFESEYFQPTADPGGPLAAMLGNQWEWTSSAYAPYPGYQAPPGALGEYNGKFMCNQLVLRGGSCATPAEHVRISYRNFFYPPDRWQFTGIRLAKDQAYR